MQGPIQIKRPDVVQDVRALADLTGVSITDAIAEAVRSQLALARTNADARLRKRRREAEKGLAEIRKLPVVGPPLTDSDLYDEDGFPK